MPSSREDVDRDSLWNQWLRSEMHSLFVDALQRFKVRVVHQQSYPVWLMERQPIPFLMKLQISINPVE